MVNSVVIFSVCMEFCIVLRVFDICFSNLCFLDYCLFWVEFFVVWNGVVFFYLGDVNRVYLSFVDYWSLGDRCDWVFKGEV